MDWRDEVLYFLLPDRFSDGQEDTRRLLTRADVIALRRATSRPDWTWKTWADAGKRGQGGTINGIQGRLDYVQGLGVTTIWVGPVFKQRARRDTYPGYGIQDFLEVDPRFGTRRDLIALVSAAHRRGMCIILDILVNHSGDNWGYVPPQRALSDARNELAFRPWPDFYGNPQNPETREWRLAWRNEGAVGFTTQPTDLTDRHDGIWPREFQSPVHYTRAGMGDLGESNVADPHAEHKRTDFFALKDLALDGPGTRAFRTLCYQYWIALTDCDGFRIDTVKHMSLEETRNFCGAIREFADTLGKRNVLLVGEIAGGDFFQDFVLDNLAVLQRNLSAALDIGSARTTLHSVAKGLAPGQQFFDHLRERSEGFESHRSLGDRHGSSLDDHDHVVGSKVRFSAEIPDDSPVQDYHVVAATALQLFSLGIPCLYYGTEQAFAGPAPSQLPFGLAEGWNDGRNHGDRYLREAMFGPDHPRAAFSNDLDTQLQTQDLTLPGFGPFGTAGPHAFDPQSPAYVRIAALCRARAAHAVLRIGRQYPRQIRLPGTGFAFPRAGEVVAWSRLLDNQEAVCLVNPPFTVVVNTAQAAVGAGAFNGSHPVGSTVPVKGLGQADEPAFLEIRDVQPAEVLVLIKAF